MSSSWSVRAAPLLAAGPADECRRDSSKTAELDAEAQAVSAMLARLRPLDGGADEGVATERDPETLLN